MTAANITELAKAGTVAIVLFMYWLEYKRNTQVQKLQDEENKRTHTVLTEMIAEVKETTKSLVRIEQKIDNNTWCPFMKKYLEENAEKVIKQ